MDLGCHYANTPHGDCAVDPARAPEYRPTPRRRGSMISLAPVCAGFGVRYCPGRSAAVNSQSGLLDFLIRSPKLTRLIRRQRKGESVPRLFLISLVCATVVVAHGPAEAAHVECSGIGFMTLDKGIGLPPGSTGNVGYSFTINCILGGSVTGSGTLNSANCLVVQGSGDVNASGKFDINGGGGVWVLTPKSGHTVAGVLQVTPVENIPFENSCNDGTVRVLTILGHLSS